MKVYILRHGECVTNFEKRLPTPDTPLTELGVQQASSAAACLSGKGIELIYSSPVARALHTAQIVAKKLRCPLVIKDGLREMSFGIFAGRKEDSTDDEVNQHMMEREKNKLTYRFPEGENFHDLQRRALPVLKEILSSRKSSVAVVAHLYINRILIAELLKMSLVECLRIKQPNDCVYSVNTETKAVSHWLDSDEINGFLLRS